MLRQVSADKAYLAALVEGGEVVSALRYGRVHNLVRNHLPLPSLLCSGMWGGGTWGRWYPISHRVGEWVKRGCEFLGFFGVLGLGFFGFFLFEY